jgi:hypothetical protein
MLIGNPEEVQTPKGLFATGDTGLHLSYYIGNYKGGRNESFMYGTDEDTNWYDYDLTSAYTTAMADLTLPDYSQGSLIPEKDFKEIPLPELLFGYYIINGSFKFPKDLKYPSIPCYIDETTTIYPLTGSCLLTGPEYLLAVNQGCSVDIKSVFYIPPSLGELDENKNVNVHPSIETVPCLTTPTTKEKRKKKPQKYTPRTTCDDGDDDDTYPLQKPFYEIIKEIQRLRGEHPKGSIQNLLYKEVGNSIYGNVVRGMSNKKSFDSLTGNYTKVTATELSNPILAS